MIPLNNVVSILSLIAVSTGAQQGRGPESRDFVVQASGDFQQAAYELGVHLAISQPGSISSDLQNVYHQLGRLRNVACPPRLRLVMDQIKQGAIKPDSTAKQLDQVEAELEKLGKDLDVTEARKHLDAARAALTEGQPSHVRLECTALVDSIVETVVGLPLREWMDGLRKATRELGDRPTPDRMAKALTMLGNLPETDRFRQKAYQEGLQTADDLVASAADLYTENQNAHATQIISRVERPLALAARASRDEIVSRQISRIEQEIKQAAALIVDSDWENETWDKGFQLLREVRSQLGELIAGSSSK